MSPQADVVDVKSEIRSMTSSGLATLFGPDARDDNPPDTSPGEPHIHSTADQRAVTVLLEDRIRREEYSLSGAT